LFAVTGAVWGFLALLAINHQRWVLAFALMVSRCLRPISGNRCALGSILSALGDMMSCWRLISSGLDVAGQRELAAERADADRLMCRKAYAAVLLKWRGGRTTPTTLLHACCGSLPAGMRPQE